MTPATSASASRRPTSSRRSSTAKPLVHGGITLTLAAVPNADWLLIAQAEVGAEQEVASVPPQDLAPKATRAHRADPIGARIQGPHDHDGGLRYRVITSAGRRWAPTGRSDAEAKKFAEKSIQTAAEQGAVTIRDSIEVYLQSKRNSGARPATITGTRDADWVWNWCCAATLGTAAHVGYGARCPRRGRPSVRKIRAAARHGR